MPKGALKRSHLRVVTPLANESLYVGVDIGKHTHIAGFVSKTLLSRHERFEGCPVLAFEQSREGFRALVDRIQTYVPLAQAYVMVVMYNQKSTPFDSFTTLPPCGCPSVAHRVKALRFAPTSASSPPCPASCAALTRCAL